MRRVEALTALTALTAAVTLSLTSAASLAQETPPPPSSAEGEAAAKWAQDLWKEAHAFAQRNAGKARAFARKAEEALQKAKKEREDAEGELGAAKARTEAAKKKAAELEERRAAAKAAATRAAEDLDFLADESGLIAKRIDEGARKTAPAKMRAEAESAQGNERARLESARSELVSVLAKEAASDAVELITKDPDSLRRLAYTLALREAGPSLARAAQAYQAAFVGLTKQPKKVKQLAATARARLDAIVPSGSVLRERLEAALRDEALAAARAIVRATAKVRVLPASLGADAKTAVAVARAAGAMAAADLHLAASAESTSRGELARHIDLSTAKERLDAAASAALTALRARHTIWSRALDKLAETADSVREVSP